MDLSNCTDSEKFIFAIGEVIAKINPELLVDHTTVKKRTIGGIVCKLGADMMNPWNEDKYGFGKINFDILFSEYKRLKKQIK